MYCKFSKHIFLDTFTCWFKCRSVNPMLWNLRVVTLPLFARYNHAYYYYCYIFIQIEMNYVCYFIEQTLFVCLIPKVLFYWITAEIFVLKVSVFCGLLWFLCTNDLGRVSYDKGRIRERSIFIMAFYWVDWYWLQSRVSQPQAWHFTCLDSDHNSFFKLYIYSKINWMCKYSLC